jgi:pimeloyl-ACP methyl ester carboxylesterase
MATSPIDDFVQAGGPLTRFGKRKWAALTLVALLAIGAAAFWARPLAFLGVFSAGQMFFSGARSQFTNVDGYRIHYYALGPSDGPVAVLVHGLGGRSEDWAKLAPFLAHAGYRVYLPDLPGYGQSDRPADFSYSVTDEARIVVGFLDALGVKQVDLGGWSMGGWVAQLVALGHPERVRRLMLFDSAGLYVKLDWDTKLFTPVSAAEIEKLDALLMPNPPHVPGYVARDILRTSHEHAWVIRRALNTMLSGQETTDNLLPSLRMPVLIVWGQVDQITPLNEGNKMHQLIPGSQMVVMPGCGHLAPNECAAAIAPFVVNFLKESPRSEQ